MKKIYTFLFIVLFGLILALLFTACENPVAPQSSKPQSDPFGYIPNTHQVPDSLKLK